MTDREFVESNWRVCFVYESRGGGEMVQFGPHSLRMWEWAAAFTRNRLEEIRQLEREIELMESWLPPMTKQYLFDDAWFADEAGERITATDFVQATQDQCRQYRILSRLQRELATLKQGMKGSQ